MRELLSQTWSNLTANKLRSFLTMFGIVWGVISIVVLTSAGEGFQRGNDHVFREFGKNIYIIGNGRTSMQAGGERAGRLIRINIDDVYALQRESRLLRHISPEIMNSVKAKSAFNAATVGASGVWPIFQEIRTTEVAQGRLMTEADNEAARRVVILGFNTAKQLFADRDPIGQEITLNGIPYTVIGKMRKKEQDSNYGNPDDDRLFVPYEAMKKDFPVTGPLTTADSLSKIIATPHDHVAAELARLSDSEGKKWLDGNGPVEAEVRRILSRNHRFDPNDREAISIWNTTIGSIMFEKVIGGMKEFFIAVSLVTLALGGIGMMNIMLIAVRERTKEIGIRKALGATSRSIQWQFMSEGLFLTLLSGGAGLLIGLGLCALVNLLPMPARFAGMIFTWEMAAFAIGVLTLIGIAASTYPARRAAALPPVEALRYDN